MSFIDKSQIPQRFKLKYKLLKFGFFHDQINLTAAIEKNGELSK